MTGHYCDVDDDDFPDYFYTKSDPRCAMAVVQDREVRTTHGRKSITTTSTKIKTVDH